LFNDSHCRIKTLNRVFNYKRHIVAQLKEYRPELVGMSVTTEIYPWAKTMSGLIKQAMDVPVIWGGIHPTSVPEEVMRNDTVDMVCVGEGEYPLLELVESMKKGAIDYSIRNIWFKRNGGLVRNEVRPLIADLDALPLSDPGLYAEWPGCLRSAIISPRRAAVRMPAVIAVTPFCTGSTREKDSMSAGAACRK
jgi:Fe-S oxidoreductase